MAYWATSCNHTLNNMQPLTQQHHPTPYSEMAYWKTSHNHLLSNTQPPGKQHKPLTQQWLTQQHHATTYWATRNQLLHNGLLSNIMQPLTEQHATTYSATNSRGVQVEKSPCAIHFLFIGVSSVTLSPTTIVIIIITSYIIDVSSVTLSSITFVIIIIRSYIIDVYSHLVTKNHHHHILHHWSVQCHPVTNNHCHHHPNLHHWRVQCHPVTEKHHHHILHHCGI